MHSGNYAHTRVKSIGLRNLKKQEWREIKPRTKPLHVGKIPNGVRSENLLRYRFRRPAENSFLELAKGFEPLTL